MNLHPIGSKHMIEVEVVAHDESDPDWPYRIVAAHGSWASDRTWVSVSTLPPVEPATPVAPAAPEVHELLGVDPGWARRQTRQAALHQAVDLAKTCIAKGVVVEHGTTVALAETFAAFLEG